MPYEAEGTMKTRTVTERVGEYLGPVDWTYDFRQHFDSYCTDDAGRQAACERAVATLKELELHPELYEVTTYGGWPRCGWGRIVWIGMYDGWPYWKPVPTVAYSTFLGVETACFNNITSVRKVVTT
jgi:hypothetical protein